ncbi:MAG: hypothetical protein PUC65_17015 [Clostridiales bacterium]|nr:hypothetical protein [Clostridiales bacterium]
MGIFSFRKKKEKRKTKEVSFEQMTVEQALQKYSKQSEETKEDVLALATENCEQIAEIRRQLEEAKMEYEAVTSYLSDIQKIDQIPLDQRGAIEEAAEEIVKSEVEQKKYKLQNKTISELQYHNMAQFEDDIERELPKLKEQEAYQLLVKEDLRQLEGEKGVQRYEIEKALAKKDFLKKLSIGSLILVFSIFFVLILLENSTGSDLMLPFFLSGILALGLIFYIVLEERRSIVALRTAEKKLNRAIVLLNKVKIKYVNCTASIDYAYEKYHVNGYQDLAYQFQEYKKMKERMAQIEKSNEQSKYYQGILIKELRKFKVVDAESWCYQAEALLDKKEMVEVRHRLNVRRQKIREQVDFNTNQLDKARNALMSLRSRHPEYEGEIKAIML